MRILDFEHFVILGENAAGTIDQSDMIIAIRHMRRPRSPFEREEQDIRIGTPFPRVRSGHGKAEEAVPPRGYGFWHGLCERLHDRVRCRAGDRIAERCCRREGRVQERAFRIDDFDTPQNTGIVRHIRVHKHQKRQDDGRGGRRVGRVHKPGRLR